MKTRLFTLLAAAAISMGTSASATLAGPLAEHIKEGKPIRLGFFVSKPGSYLTDDGKPAGNMNTITLGVLEKMGFTKIEPNAMDWGGQIPALDADRIDIVTGGLYITKKRCESVAFSNPVIVVPNSLVVQKGNPKGLENYQDLLNKGAILAVVSGFATIEQAKHAGISEDHMMAFPGNTQALAAVKAGRADAFATSSTEAEDMAKSSNGELEATNPDKMPDKNYVAVGFRKSDADFVTKFNEAAASYVGSPEMMKATAADGYNSKMLPGDVKADEICKNL